jgi:hypothetical protein
MVFLLRLLLWKKASLPTVLCAFLQDAFIAAQLSLLPTHWALFVPLFLYQWIGILIAARLKIRLTPALFPLVKHASHFTDSAKDFLPLALLGASCFWLVPQEWPTPVVVIGLLGGPLAAYGSRRLDSAQELASSNPLFYLQWRGWIHPAASKKWELPSYAFPHEQAIPLSKDWPVWRKTVRFLGPEELRIERKPRPNILFIFLESFRAQNIGALGARIGASPCFDALAEEGALFTQCTATGPFTFYATVSSLCGVQPSLNTFSLQSYQEISFISLPRILSERGYKTAWFDGGYTTFGGKLPFSKRNGIAEIWGAEALGKEGFSWGVHDEKVFDRALKWMKEQPQPLFASLFTLTNHHPWNTPADWNPKTPAVVDPTYRHFLNAFSYTDAMLGRFVEGLRREKLLENTILFITGDHGQETGDGCETHIVRTDLSQQNLHVPLLIYAPGKVQPQTIPTPCSHIDLMPTVLDWLELESPHHCLGRSLLRQVAQPVYFSLPASIPRWGCRAGPFKWTGFANGKEEELFDLEKDPDETTNIAAALKEKAEELKRETLAYFEGTEKLFARNAWAPHTDPEEEIFRVAPNASDTSVRMKKKFSIVDLSAASKLTDKTLLSIAKQNPHLRYLSFPRSPYVTDRALFAVADHCPSLIGFSSLDCPLLTSEGVTAILEKCSQLKLLSLDGADEIVHLNPPSELSLSSLFLGEGIPIAGQSLLRLIQQSPRLTSLKANIGALIASDLAALAERLSQLQQLCLFEAKELTDELLQKILARNPQLSWLKITGSPSLSFIDLENRPQFQWLEFQNCPNLKNID